MNLVDICLLVVILYCIIAGYRSGVIKTLVKLVGLFIVACASYYLKDIVADFLITHLPFYNYGGETGTITSVNIMVYQAVAFVFLFIILYSVLNIILIFAGLVDRLIKMTVIFAMPDKILGGVVGFVEGVMYSFIIVFAISQIPHSQQELVSESIANDLLMKTPIIRNVFGSASTAGQEVASILLDSELSAESKDITILQTLIMYGMISADKAQSLIDSNKIQLPNITVSGITNN